VKKENKCSKQTNKWAINIEVFLRFQVCLAQDSGGLREEEEIISFGRPPGLPDSVFSPIVTASCRAGVMTIKAETLQNFIGVVHSRDFRKPGTYCV